MSNSKLGLQGLEEEEEEAEGDDEEEEEGSLTEKSHDEAPESPSPVTTGVYEEDEEEEETETAPLSMSYEHTRRYSVCYKHKQAALLLNCTGGHSLPKSANIHHVVSTFITSNANTKQHYTLRR